MLLVLVNYQHWLVGTVGIFWLVLLFLSMVGIWFGITVNAIFCLTYFSKLAGTFLKILQDSFFEKFQGKSFKKRA
jgi:hypothetical protein